MHAKIRQALGKGRHTSLLRLIAPVSNPSTTSATQTQIYTNKDDIHDKIIDYNIKHYSKAESSPVGIQEPLYKKIGNHRTSKFCDEVLNGNMRVEDLDDIPMAETIELLHSTIHPTIQKSNTQSPTPIPSINIDLQKEDYKKNI